jgi:hypothetical protein
MTTITMMRRALAAATLVLAFAGSAGSQERANVFKTGTLVTTANTADQVIVTDTVTALKTYFVEYLSIEGELTVASATATILGTVSLELPSGIKVVSHRLVNPTSSAPDRVVYTFAEPIPIGAGSVVRVVCTPTAATSMTWTASLGGYER